MNDKKFYRHYVQHKPDYSRNWNKPIWYFEDKDAQQTLDSMSDGNDEYRVLMTHIIDEQAYDNKALYTEPIKQIIWYPFFMTIE